MIIIVLENTMAKKRNATLFPKNKRFLTQLGENIKLACKRRGFTQTLIADRTGLSRLTIRKIEQGDPSVSMGHYVVVLSILGLVEDLTLVALDDKLGRKLQDIKLMGKNHETSS